MEIKVLECPSCGGKIEINEAKKTGKCKYCNSPYIFDDGVIRVEYSFADEESKRKIANANVALYKYQLYEKSLPLYKELFEKFQDNQDFLLGIILSLTNDFSKEFYTEKEIKKVLYYWDLFYKIGDSELIAKYQKDIDKIKEKYENIKAKKKKRNKIILFSILAIILIIIIIYIIQLTAKPSKKNIVLKTSKTNNNVGELINENLLKCDYKDQKIEGDKIIIDFLCSNLVQNNKKYTFSYDYIDDDAPYIDFNTCHIEEGDKPSFEICLGIYDSIDGWIKDYEVNEEDADYNKAGTTKVEIKAKDKSGNELSTKISVEVNKIKITNMKLTIDGSNYRVSGTTKAHVTLEPAKLKDKTVKFTSSNSGVASIDSNGTIKFIKPGKTEICATSNYDKEEKVCKEITINVQCKNTYIFNFDATGDKMIYANTDYCPGTYRVYAPKVDNYNDSYYVDVYYNSNSYVWDKTISIYKWSSHLNDEGYKISLGNESKIKITAGIRQFKLVKAE